MSQNIQTGVNALVSKKKYKSQMGKGKIIDIVNANTNIQAFKGWLFISAKSVSMLSFVFWSFVTANLNVIIRTIRTDVSQSVTGPGLVTY